jgi:hypothetical protein
MEMLSFINLVSFMRKKAFSDSREGLRRGGGEGRSFLWKL